MILIRLQWTDKQKAIDASVELSTQLKQPIFVYAQTIGFAPYETIEYLLQETVFDEKSPNVVHIQQPGKKTINEILEQNDERETK